MPRPARLPCGPRRTGQTSRSGAGGSARRRLGARLAPPRAIALGASGRRAATGRREPHVSTWSDARDQASRSRPRSAISAWTSEVAGDAGQREQQIAQLARRGARGRRWRSAVVELVALLVDLGEHAGERRASRGPRGRASRRPAARGRGRAGAAGTSRARVGSASPPAARRSSALMRRQLRTTSSASRTVTSAKTCG